ncbi:hypothetical protein ACOSP7_031870 [Xanthoceras sorbifolium]
MLRPSGTAMLSFQSQEQEIGSCGSMPLQESRGPTPGLKWASQLGATLNLTRCIEPIFQHLNTPNLGHKLA